MARRAPPLKLAVLISGRGSNLQAIIEAFGASAPNSPVKIALVLSDRPEAAGLIHAEQAGVPARSLEPKAFPNRQAFEAAMDRALREAGSECVALAGFMRLLSADFVGRWRDRLVNIHPSLLPAFPGLHTHRRALAAGVRLHGCTVHMVRAAVDSGPIIGQAVVPVLGEDDETTLAARVLTAEHLLYPSCLRLIAEGRVRIEDERAILRDAAFAGGVLLNPLGG